MEKDATQVALQILVTDSSVRLYGNRTFFKYLKAEIDRLIDCPVDGYCEFQTVSLAADRPRGLEARPNYKVLRMGSAESDITLAREMRADEYDVVLMTLEDGAFT